jgi:hypothetical protein
MDSNSPNPNDKNLQTIYSAFVNYHNALAQVRFTIAGLYIAATGFLVNSWFNLDHLKSIHFSIPILGFILTLVCWLLEIRTYQLLYNLGTRGNAIEKEMMIRSDISFFGLMTKQPYGPINPFSDKEIKPPLKVFKKYLFSHSFGFTILYSVILIFWIYQFSYIYLALFFHFLSRLFYIYL